MHAHFLVDSMPDGQWKHGESHDKHMRDGTLKDIALFFPRLGTLPRYLKLRRRLIIMGNEADRSIPCQAERFAATVE
jgi:hypothetical protein